MSGYNSQFDFVQQLFLLKQADIHMKLLRMESVIDIAEKTMEKILLDKRKKKILTLQSTRTEVVFTSPFAENVSDPPIEVGNWELKGVPIASASAGRGNVQQLRLESPESEDLKKTLAWIDCYEPCLIYDEDPKEAVDPLETELILQALGGSTADENRGLRLGSLEVKEQSHPFGTDHSKHMNSRDLEVLMSRNRHTDLQEHKLEHLELNCPTFAEELDALEEHKQYEKSEFRKVLYDDFYELEKASMPNAPTFKCDWLQDCEQSYSGPPVYDVDLHDMLFSTDEAKCGIEISNHELLGAVTLYYKELELSGSMEGGIGNVSEIKDIPGIEFDKEGRSQEHKHQQQGSFIVPKPADFERWRLCKQKQSKEVEACYEEEFVIDLAQQEEVCGQTDRKLHQLGQCGESSQAKPLHHLRVSSSIFEETGVDLEWTQNCDKSRNEDPHDIFHPNEKNVDDQTLGYYKKNWEMAVVIIEAQTNMLRPTKLSAVVLTYEDLALLMKLPEYEILQSIHDTTAVVSAVRGCKAYCDMGWTSRPVPWRDKDKTPYQSIQLYCSLPRVFNQDGTPQLSTLVERHSLINEGRHELIFLKLRRCCWFYMGSGRKLIKAQLNMDAWHKEVLFSRITIFDPGGPTFKLPEDSSTAIHEDMDIFKEKGVSGRLY